MLLISHLLIFFQNQLIIKVWKHHCSLKYFQNLYYQVFSHVTKILRDFQFIFLNFG